MLSEATIASLKSNMRGELIEPSDARYDEARKGLQWHDRSTTAYHRALRAMWQTSSQQ